VENRYNALYDLGQQLVLLRDPAKIAEAVLEIAAQVLNLQDSDFLLVDETLNELYVTAKQGELRRAEGLRLPLKGEKGITVAAIRRGQPIYAPDIRKDPRYVNIGFPAVSEFAVPVQIEGRVLGVLNVESAEMDAFSEADRELLCILANQAALALENACLHAQETRKIEEMAVLNELNRRISASLDLQETLDAVVASASELIPCALAEVSLWDAQTGMLTLQAIRSEPNRGYPVGRSFPPGEGFTGWVVREAKPLLVSDVESFQEIKPDLLPDERPFKAYAGVPLLVGNTLVGTLVLVSNQSGAFDQDNIRLLQSLANQAAIAIRNAQLYQATRRREAELAALNIVASVINQPLPLQEILDSSIVKVIEVMETDAGGIRLLNPETEELKIVSSEGLSPDYIDQVDNIPLGEGVVGSVAQNGEPQVIMDIADGSQWASEIAAKEGFHSFAVVPLRTKDRIVGTLGVVTRQFRDFSSEELGLLTAIGHQIGVAVENARLYEDLARRAKDMEAVLTVAAAVNRPEDLDFVLEEGLKQVLAVTGLEMGAIAIKDPKSESLVLKIHRGMSEEWVTWLERKLKEKSADWPKNMDVHIEKVPEDSSSVLEGLHQEGIRLTAYVPLFAEGNFVGLLTVATPKTQIFTPEERSLPQAIGHQLGTAISNAQLREEALNAERLAAVGRVAASVAHDLRSPLGGILRSAEFLARPELSPGTREKLSRAIVSLAQRLNNTSLQILDYVQKDRLPLRCTPCSLSKFLEEVLTVLEVDFSDRGIEVERNFHYRGKLIMDGDRMAQVVYNIAANARDAMPEGGKFVVNTRKVKDRVELRFSDTGPGVPKEVVGRIFEPFFSYGKRQGAGLGLAIAQRIIKEHGGTILVESKEGKGAEFVVTLPL